MLGAGGRGGGAMRGGEKIRREGMHESSSCHASSHTQGTSCSRRDVSHMSSSSPRFVAFGAILDYAVEKREKYAFYSVETVRIKQYFTATVSSSTAWEQTSTYCSAKRVENSARRHGKKEGDNVFICFHTICKMYFYFLNV